MDKTPRRGLLSAFNRSVDRLPLAGKYWTEPCAKAYTRAKPERDPLKFGATAALIGGLVLVHAWQTRSGMGSLLTHMEHVENTDSLRNGLFMGIDTTFTLVNAAVAVRQTSLLHQLNQIRKRRKGRAASSPPLQYKGEAQETREGDPIEPPKPKEAASLERKTDQNTYYRNRFASMCWAGVVTIAGSVAFMASDKDADTLSCVVNAQEILDIYETSGFTNIVASETIRLANSCGVSPDRLER